VDERIQRASEHWDAQGFGIWAIREKATGSFVGHCGLLVDRTSGTELIYALARQSWGHGFASEASSIVLDCAFSTLGLSEICALVFPKNTVSGRVLEKLGFEPDGEAHRFETRLLRYVLCP
jgi:ribosomal-protein-alanine N-acetyltransferase